MVHSANIIHTLSIFLITFQQTYAERSYQFEVYVSSIFWSGTVDEIFFRLCNSDENCGSFQSVPAGWKSEGQTYSYKYITNTDIGDIYKVEIVHPGSDMLCVGHIKIDGIEYDENEHRWIDLPHCIEDQHGGGCDTITVILPTNDWHSMITIPCEYKLYATHSPIQSPTQPPTLKPTINPTISRETGAQNPTIPTSEIQNTPTIYMAVAPANAHSSAGDTGAIVGGIIGALLASVLCLSLIVIIFCYKKRQKKDNEIENFETENNGIMVTAQSTVSSYEGTVTTKGTTQTPKGTIIRMTQKKRNRERVELIDDYSSDDATDDELYDNHRRNMTKRIPTDDEDENENVVPK